MSTEINKTPEKPKPNYKLRRRAALALIAVASFTAGVNAGAKENNPRPVKPDQNTLSRIDPSIESVTIEKGAKLRENPAVTDAEAGLGNILDKADKQIKIKADNDIATSFDVNGEWFGVPAESIKRIDPDLKVEGDSDGYVWINEQKATAKVNHDADDGAENASVITP